MYSDIKAKTTLTNAEAQKIMQVLQDMAELCEQDADLDVEIGGMIEDAILTLKAE